MRPRAAGAAAEEEAAEAPAPSLIRRRRPRPMEPAAAVPPPAAPPAPATLALSSTSSSSSSSSSSRRRKESPAAAAGGAFPFPFPFGAAGGAPALCQPHPYHHPDDPHTTIARGEQDNDAAAAAAAAASAAATAAAAAAAAATATGAMPAARQPPEIRPDHEGGLCPPCSQAWATLLAAWREGEGAAAPPASGAPSREAIKAEAAAGAAAAEAALSESLVASAPGAAAAAGAVMGTAAGSAAAAAAAKAGSWTHTAVAASTALLKFNCGLIGGITQAGMFNPWDRALYLSVKHARPFLSLSNFSRPYQGFWQAIVQRTLSTGLYFPLEDLFMQPCHEAFDNQFLAAWMAGTLAGACNGVALNPASAIKYQTWGQDNASFWRTARLMWRDGHIRPFLKGTSPTILRDLTFGGVYSLLRNGLLRALREVQGESAPRPPPLAAGAGGRKGGGKDGVAAPVGMESFFLNVAAAGIATTVSGPFNYVRNIKYSFPADMAPPSSLVILQDLWQEVLSKPLLSQQLSLLQERLRVGWGTARVAVGMGFTSHVYEYCKYGTEGKAGRQLRRRLTGRAPGPEEEGEDEEEDGGPVPVVPDSE